MIGILFNLNSMLLYRWPWLRYKIKFHVGKEAISMNRRLHDQRIRTNGIPSPETGCMYPFLIIISYKTLF